MIDRRLKIWETLLTRALRHDEARQEISRLLRENSAVLLDRLERVDLALREDFAAIDVIEYRPTYDECVSRLKSAMTV